MTKQLKIIGDSAEAAAALRTNRPVKTGDVIASPAHIADQLAHDHPELFKVLIVAIAPAKEDAVAGHQENKLGKPGKNKLLKKNEKFKSKD